MDPTTQELYESVNLGEEARNFIYSPLGRGLMQDINQNIKELQIKLEETAPEANQSIRDIQHEIKNLRRFPRWLMEKITEAENALQVLDESEIPEGDDA